MLHKINISLHNIQLTMCSTQLYFTVRVGSLPVRHEQESSLSRATSALRGPKRANLALHTVRMRFRRAGSSSGSPPHGTGAPRGQTQAGIAPDPDRDAVSDLDPDPDPSLAPRVWSLTPVHSPFSTGMLFQT